MTEVACVRSILVASSMAGPARCGLSRSFAPRPAGQIPSGAPGSDWLHELAVSRDIVANSSVEYQKWGGQIASSTCPRFVFHGGHAEFVVRKEGHGLLLLMSCNHGASLGTGAPVRDGEDGNCKPEAAHFG